MTAVPHRGLGNQIFFVLVAGASLATAPLVRAVLPAQFLLDDSHLQVTMGEGVLRGDSTGFLATGLFYETLGLAHAPTGAALLGIVTFTVAVLLAMGWDRLRNQTIPGLALLVLAYVLALAYIAQFSKEMITLLVTVVVLLAPRSRWGDLLVLAAGLVYAVTLREYWFLVMGMYVVWRVCLAHVRRPLLLVLVPVVAYAALTPVFQVALHGGLQSQREWANSERAPGTEVASLITSPFPGATGALGVVSALLMVVLLAAPVTLAVSGGIYHLASAVVIVLIWAAVLSPVARGRFAGPRPVQSVRSARAASLLLAMLVIQALFEPDYGSYLKHLTPLMPLVLALLPASNAVGAATAAPQGYAAPQAGAVAVAVTAAHRRPA